ncbi:MAG: hypothetical protein Q8P39_02660 [Candidatus Yanofskybacteria bacterium]|nr:hypothetical protein [Candidatus Yanofskybacteria bacterium]
METKGTEEPRDARAIRAPATMIGEQSKKSIAQKLRKKGLSIGEIALELDMHKSGVISKWCQGIELTLVQRGRLKKKELDGATKGSRILLSRARQEKAESINEIRRETLQEIGKITKRDLFLCGLGLYWGEGYKYKGGEIVGFTNTDPRTILIMLKWFRDIGHVSDESFRFRVQINIEHEGRVEEIKEYWSRIVGFSLKQFTKTSLVKVKTRKIFLNPQNYHGTLRVTICGGSKLRRRIHGWIEAAAENV